MTTIAEPRAATGSALSCTPLFWTGSSPHTTIDYRLVTSTSFSERLLSYDLVFDSLPMTLVLLCEEGSAEPVVTDGASEAVETVERVSRILGLTVEEVLRAAQIKKRTFYHWKSKGGSTPRLSSQGQLWSLAQTVEVLDEQLGHALAGWLRRTPPALAALRRHDFETLVQLARPRALEDADLEERARRQSAGYFDEAEGTVTLREPVARVGRTVTRVPRTPRPEG